MTRAAFQGQPGRSCLPSERADQPTLGRVPRLRCNTLAALRCQLSVSGLFGGARVAGVVVVAVVSITACAAHGPVRRSPAPGRSPRSTNQVTRFGALALRHPAAWRAFLTRHDGDLPNGDGAYLTNEPINPRCPQTRARDATLLHCSAEFAFPRRPGPGGVWVEMELDYMPRGHRPVGHLNVDGYHAAVASSVGVDAGGFPTDRSGLPVPYCDSGTRYAVQVTGTAPTTLVQPSGFVITGCFGAHTGRARQAFGTMLRGATIATRPSQTAPVPGATPCTHNHLRLTYFQQGASSSIIASYTFTNVGRATCRLVGYPRLVLLTAAGNTVGHLTFRHQGRAAALYLRPKSSLAATTQTFLNPDLHETTHVTTERIQLPGIAQPFTKRLAPGGLVIYGKSATIDVSPLQGD